MRKTILAAAAVLSVAGLSQASTIYGIDQHNVLFSFDSANPQALSNARTINFVGGPSSGTPTQAVAIDFRVSDGLLYVLTNTGQLYSVNVNASTQPSGLYQANFVNSLNDGSGNNPLAGSSFGMDFNPVPNLLRITSDTDVNLRHNPAGTTIVDGTLNAPYGNPLIVGSAYSNNDNDPSTGTTLYNIDAGIDSLTIQNPPNNGTQGVVGSGLGIDVNSEEVGFDIETGTNVAFLAANVGADRRSGLYTVNLTTGTATSLGLIGGGLLVRDISVVIPEPTTAGLVAGLAIAGLRSRRRA